MEQTMEYPRVRWLILVAAVFGYMSMQVANLSIAPMLPQIAKDLSVDMGAATNLMTAFLFSASIALLFAGIVSDRFGVMAAVTLGLACAAIPAALMPWIGTSYTAVFWARIFEGFSVGFLLSAMGAIIAQWFPPREKGLAGGLMGAFVSVGSAIGILAGPAVFVATGSWRLTSAWLSIIAWIGLVFSIILLATAKLQPPAQAMAGDGPPPSDSRPFRTALFSMTTLAGIIVSFFANWCLQCLYGLTPAYLSAEKPIGAGFGPMMSGQLMLAVMIAGIIGPVIGGLLTDRAFKGNVKPVMATGFAMCFVFIYLIQAAYVQASIPFLLTALILAGVAVQFVFPGISVYIAKTYQLQVVGKMTGLWFGIGAFGGVLGLLIGSVTVNKLGAYNMAIVLIALAGLAGFIFALLLPRPKP